jgi:DHA2 family multidrug resistance protein
LFVPINSAVLSQFQGEQLGQAAGMLNLFRQIGGSIGIAGLSTFLDRFGSQFRNDLRTYVNSSQAAATNALAQTQASLGSGFPASRGLNPGSLGILQSAGGALKSLQGRMEQQVFQLSFDRIMIWVLVIYMFSLIPLYTMKLNKPIKGAVSAH